MTAPTSSIVTQRGVRLKYSHVIPLSYWLSTRVKDLVGVFAYFVYTVCFLLLGMLAAGLWNTASLELLGLAWLAYWSVYEIGYLMNDLWSQRRESNAFQTRKPPPESASRLILVAAIASRVLLAALILSGISGDATRTGLAILIGSMALVFVAHNVLLGKARLLTYFLLQWVRYFLIVAIAPNWHTVIVVCALSIPPSAAATFAYLNAKNYFELKWWLRFRTISLPLKLMAGLFLLESLAFVLAGQRGFASMCVAFAGAAVLLDLLYVATRAARVILWSFSPSPERYHAHTDLSHDGGWPASSMAEAMKESDVSTTYVTEHVEDMSAGQFARLTTACAAASAAFRVNLVPGIEYSILGQHFLAIGLDSYVEVDGSRLDSTFVLKRHCRTVIWAHPRIAVRRLVRSPAYLLELLGICCAVDGIEWLNLKPNRGMYEHTRCLSAFLVATWLRGDVEGYTGHDAHNLRDWGVSERRLRRLQRLFRIPARIARALLGPRVLAGASGRSTAALA